MGNQLKENCHRFSYEGEFYRYTWKENLALKEMQIEIIYPYEIPKNFPLDFKDPTFGLLLFWYCLSRSARAKSSA